MEHGTRYTVTFDTGANSGAQDTTTNFDKFDLSWCEAIDIWVSLTTADTDAGDTFDIYLQETMDGVTWDERWHSHQFTGNMTASSTAPEVRRYRIFADTTDAPDEIYETSGSAGGSSLSAGSVRHGPFVPKLPSTSAPFSGQVTHRLRFVTADADSNARFAGSITFVLHSDI